MIYIFKESAKRTLVFNYPCLDVSLNGNLAIAYEMVKVGENFDMLF